MSSLLFVVVREAVSKMMDKAVMEGRLSGFSVGTSTGDHLQVSHLPFADDTSVSCDVDIDQMLFLCLILSWFEIVSGLKINLDKSELVPVGVVPNFEMLVDALGCKQGSLAMKYLGLPLGAKWKDRAKYGVEEGDWCSNFVLGSYGVSLWKTISSGWSTFSHYIQF